MREGNYALTHRLQIWRWCQGVSVKGLANLRSHTHTVYKLRRAEIKKATVRGYIHFTQAQVETEIDGEGNRYI